MKNSNQGFSKYLANKKRVKFTLFGLFGFCIVAISIAFFTLSLIKPNIGAVVSRHDQGWTVESLDNGGLALTAGIKVGDTVIVINGQSIQTFQARYPALNAIYLINDLGVIGPNGQLVEVNLKDSSPTWNSQIELITLFIVCLIFWIIGFYVFFKKPQNQAASLLYLCGLAFGIAITGNAATQRLVTTAVQFEVIGSTIGPWLLLHFFLVLPENRGRLQRTPLIYLIYLLPVITLFLFPLIGYSHGQPLAGFRALRIFEDGVGFLASLILIVIILNYSRSISPRTKQQMKLILASCFLALFPILLLSILPELIWGRTIIPSQFSILFLVLLPLGMGYAAITGKLLDIDVIVRRSLIYGLITVLMAAILSLGIFLAMSFQNMVGIPEKIMLALVLGFAAVIIFGPTKRRFELIVDKFFFKDRYDYHRLISDLNVSLNSMEDLAEVSRVVVGTTVRTLNLTGACLFIKGKQEIYNLTATQGIFDESDKCDELETLMHERDPRTEFPNPVTSRYQDLSYIIPIGGGEKPIAFLFLAPKVSKQDFSSDDLYFIQDLALVSFSAFHSALLIKAVSLRENFISIASHELRTPLVAIVGYSDLLLMKDYPEVTRKRWIQYISQSGKVLTEMVNDLLDVTRIKSGEIAIKLEDGDISDLVKSPLQMVRERTALHEFVVNIPPDLPHVIIDCKKLEHVISNLLDNAVKYSPKGGTIAITAVHNLNSNRVVLSIADQGIGISKNDVSWLFKTFHRIKRPETMNIRGAGLGLYIAKEWIVAMKGEVWVESELNKGSTFFISFPIQDVE